MKSVEHDFESTALALQRQKVDLCRALLAVRRGDRNAAEVHLVSAQRVAASLEIEAQSLAGAQARAA